MATTAKTTKTERKPAAKRKPGSSKAQFERFVETARQIGVDEDPEALDRAFRKIAPTKAPNPKAESINGS